MQYRCKKEIFPCVEGDIVDGDEDYYLPACKLPDYFEPVPDPQFYKAPMVFNNVYHKQGCWIPAQHRKVICGDENPGGPRWIAKSELVDFVAFQEIVDGNAVFSLNPNIVETVYPSAKGE